MDIQWFYIAVCIAFSDILHGILWHALSDFYILLGEVINNIVKSSFKTWIVHELLEAIFHVIIVGLLFQSATIGVLAGTIHFIVDLGHGYYNLKLTPIQHRALHFVVESIFFMTVLAI